MRLFGSSAYTSPVANAPVRRLDTVECGRGVAALAVVAFHVNASAGFLGLSQSRWAAPLQFGVDFFFVLSGFIISHVHSADVGKPAAARAFAIKRFVRLYPLLWIVVGGWIALKVAVGEAPALSTAANSLLLWPSDILPEPGVVWTLRHEMLFYAAFMVLIVSRRIGAALFAAWIAAVVAQMGLIAAGHPVEGTGAMVLSSFGIDFLLGAVVAAVFRRRQEAPWWPFVIGVLAVAAYAAAWLTFGWGRAGTTDYVSTGNLFVPLNGLAFAVLLYGMLGIERQVTVPRFARLLGAASYAIYLSHTPVIAVFKDAAALLGDGWAQLSLFLVATLAGIFLHLMVERPLTRHLRRRLIPRGA